MISVRLPKEMEERIERLARSTHRPKSFFVREALNHYLEDMEDYYDVLKRVNDPQRKLITLEELEDALALSNRD